MKDILRRHPRLALPFSILTQPGTVRLVAGEDFRYTFSAPQIEEWLPAFLAKLDGKTDLPAMLESLGKEHHADAQQLIKRLYGERILVDASACDAHTPASAKIIPEGCGPLLAMLKQSPAHAEDIEPGSQDCLPHPYSLRVLCQDTLDYDAALNFNQRCMDASGEGAWMWVTIGPLNRAYVSPVFLKQAGPCLACLIHHFKSLSPAPEIYDHLIAHSQAKKALTPVANFPQTALTMLQQIVLWKREQLQRADPPAALYRLHVLEVETLEVSTHRVFANPQCSACRR